MAQARRLRQVGHKGADTVVAGNTIESFRAAAELGVSTIEFDVVWTPAGDPTLPAAEREPLQIAHDIADAARRRAPSLGEALDALAGPGLDHLEFNLDLKRTGREDEVAAALRERGLTDRAMFSTMEIESVQALQRIDPELRRGLTFPKVGKPWDKRWWAKPAVAVALEMMRRRLPAEATTKLTELEASATWVFHQLITPGLARAMHEIDVELIAWTVDDAPRMRELVAMGVDGICSNDPRLFSQI